MSLKALRDALGVNARAARAHANACEDAARAAEIAVQEARITLAEARSARDATYDAFYVACDAVHNERAP